MIRRQLLTFAIITVAALTGFDASAGVFSFFKKHKPVLKSPGSHLAGTYGYHPTCWRQWPGPAQCQPTIVNRTIVPPSAPAQIQAIAPSGSAVIVQTPSPIEPLVELPKPLVELAEPVADALNQVEKTESKIDNYDPGTLVVIPLED